MDGDEDDAIIRKRQDAKLRDARRIIASYTARRMENGEGGEARKKTKTASSKRDGLNLWGGEGEAQLDELLIKLRRRAA